MKRMPGGGGGGGCVWGGGGGIFIHTLTQVIFWGSKNLNFNILGGFQKNKFLGY